MRSPRSSAAETDVDARYLCWFPDEWTSPTPPPLPVVEKLLADLKAWLDDEQNLPDDQWHAGRAAVVELIIQTLDSAEIREVFADAGAVPVLVVHETDGGTEGAVASLDRLNVDHPDRGLVADARAFWLDEG
ncbi:hypothetical protein [Nocardioides sp. AE5]|uniref:hypothetical protein n=1 Tax=Nocardioides sp. AE5 TaxID=2962573 RepID=UPI002881E440|nr:hypothetical protein [Nocardioides sp. AE5]MDT0200769.1 hypothetical protein [Nocardioides sp. AE5]